MEKFLEDFAKIPLQKKIAGTATIYQLQKLRCHLCGEVFTAPAPAEVGDAKYDATAGSMIALLKYGSGLPFNRLEGLQGHLGIPLPASTQWDIVEAVDSDDAHTEYRAVHRFAPNSPPVRLKVIELSP